MLQSITLCCRVPIALCCRILLRVTEYYPALQSITPCYRDPTTPVWAVSADNIKHIRVTEYYSVLEYYPVLQSIIPRHRVLLRITGAALPASLGSISWQPLLSVLQSITPCYRVLPHVTEYYSVLQGPHYPTPSLGSISG